MKKTIKFKVQDLRGRQLCISKEIDFPDFEPISEKYEIGDKIYQSVTSVEQQVMDYLDDEMDKSFLIEEYDLMAIIDYKVVAKSEKKKFVDYVKIHLQDCEEQFKADFIATYSVIKNNIKNMSFAKRIDMIYAAMTVGYKASTNSYRHVINFIDRLNEDESSQTTKMIK